MQLPSNFSLERARHAQRAIASKVVEKDVLPPVIRRVAGIDVAYYEDTAVAAAVAIDSESLRELRSCVGVFKVRFPYIPTLLAFREVYPSWAALRKLDMDYDVIMVDGNGRLHPFRAGFACHLGVVVDKPTIGVAKRLLCGSLGKWRDATAPVYMDGEIVGMAVKTRKGSRPLYVSVGHKISLKTAVRLVMVYRRKNAKLPEPLRLAHLRAKDGVRRLLSDD